MSGIQEWRNAVMLFVNVYGEGYKNVFLDEGREITWFAQARQWEGTPVIQRLINAAGGNVVVLPRDDGDHRDGDADEDEDEETTIFLDPTPVLLFARAEGEGYVYCGELDYVAHDPDRLPIRFVWRLRDHDALKDAPPFNDLLKACAAIFPTSPEAS